MGVIKISRPDPSVDKDERYQWNDMKAEMNDEEEEPTRKTRLYCVPGREGVFLPQETSHA